MSGGAAGGRMYASAVNDHVVVIHGMAFLSVPRQVWAQVMAALLPAAGDEARWEAWEALLQWAPPEWAADSGEDDSDLDARLSDLCWAAAVELPARQLIEESADLEVRWWAAGLDRHDSPPEGDLT